MLVAHSGFFLRPHLMQKYKSSEPGPWAQSMPEILHDHFYIYKLLCPTSFFGYLNYCLLNVSKILILQKGSWILPPPQVALSNDIEGERRIAYSIYSFCVIFSVIARVNCKYKTGPPPQHVLLNNT